MSRKRTKKNPKDEVNAMKKILCDEAQNQMKVFVCLAQNRLIRRSLFLGEKLHQGFSRLQPGKQKNKKKQRTFDKITKRLKKAYKNNRFF